MSGVMLFFNKTTTVNMRFSSLGLLLQKASLSFGSSTILEWDGLKKENMMMTPQALKVTLHRNIKILQMIILMNTISA